MKSPLILMHGALGSTAQFDRLTPLLASTFEVHTFNFAGHGGKVCTEDFSMDMFVHDLNRFMELKQIEKADLFGYSMGGYVALIFAEKHPEKVDRIVTLGTKFDWNPDTAAEQVKLLDPEVIEAKVPHFAEALARIHHPIDWKEVVLKTAGMMHHLGNGGACDFAGMSIPHEVIIAVGDLDRMVKFGEAVAVADLLSNAKFEPLAGAPHPIEQVDVQILAQKIHAWFPMSGS